MESTAFGVFVLSTFQKWTFRKPGLQAMNTYLRDVAGSLVKKLGFFMKMG